MSEIIARIGAGARVELIDDRSTIIKSIEPMTPLDAAHLARGLLSCAAVLSIENALKIGAIVDDAHFPILKWEIKPRTPTDRPTLIVSIPPGIELTFQLTKQVEKELGAALVAHADGLPPPEQSHSVLH